VSSPVLTSSTCVKQIMKKKSTSRSFFLDYKVRIYVFILYGHFSNIVYITESIWTINLFFTETTQFISLISKPWIHQGMLVKIWKLVKDDDVLIKQWATSFVCLLIKFRLNTLFGPLIYFWFSFWSPNYKVSQFGPISIPPFTNIVFSVSFLISKIFDIVWTIRLQLHYILYWTTNT